MSAGLNHDEHARRVSHMFGRIAGPYDLLNRVLSMGADKIWRKKLVSGITLGPTGRCLDLAAGTLDVSLDIMKMHRDMQVLAMDFALPMLVKGKDKLTTDHTGRIDIVQADGRKLPLVNACADAVTIAFGIRNIRPRSAAYEEILRVLAPGGALHILEFGSGKRRIWKGLYNFYLRRLLPFIGGLVSGDKEAYTYLADTIAEFPDEDVLAEELRTAGFARVEYTALFSGIVFIHRAWKA
jgi:demethylmenaquinone methyltransferase/2-methoxy-6-polyprenyl-1,4-benzoquinol methylase